MAMPRLAAGTSFMRCAVDEQIAAGDRLKPGDHAQQRGLAAARRADENRELTGLDIEVDAVDHLHVAVVACRPSAGRRWLPCTMLISVLRGRQPALVVRMVAARSARLTSWSGLGRMVERRHHLQRPARVRAGHRQRALPVSASWNRAICVWKRDGTCLPIGQQRIDLRPSPRHCAAGFSRVRRPDYRARGRSRR